jgi:outer membrane immunogenic protein
MKRALLAGVAALGALSPAFAADIPPAPPPVYRAPVVAPPVIYNWTGIYIGINGGYGWARGSTDVGGVTFTGDRLSGPLAGGQIGFNYQLGMFVLGAEFDGQWANIKKTYTVAPDSLTIKVNSFFTGRARAGVAFDNFLLYVTGGGMYGTSKAEATIGGVSGSSSSGRFGWTVGGGAEAGWGPWSVRAEYLYLRTADESSTFFGTTFTSRVDAHVVRGALNYRWGPTVSARY